ncbi:HAD-IA family hydrolase [bacterium]|nr:HAD-IA family hydrolase [bacterium]
MKTLIFDFDGTVVDSFDLGLSIFNDIAKRYNKNDLSDLSTEEIRSMHALQVVRHFGIPFYQIPFYVYLAKKDFKKNIVTVKAFPQIKSVLEALKDDYQLAILSSNSRSNITKVLKNNDIDIFDFIHSGSSIFGKARAIKSAVRKQGLKLSDIAYIGDEARDVDAAKSMGIPMIAVCWGYNSKDLLAKHNPDILVDDFSDLLSAARSVLPHHPSS